LVAYRLIDPGSEWRLHRHWFDHTALADLLGGDFALAAKDTLYRCHDRLLDHKEALFSHLHDRWRDLFNATNEVLEQMKRSDPPTAYLVGTPKGRLNKLEADLANRPWQQAREGVEVKLLTQEHETYVLARSRDRVAKERAMRRRRLRRLLNRLKELAAPSMRPRTRDNLLRAIGAAEKEAGKDGRHVTVMVDEKPDAAGAYAVRYRLDRQRLRRSRRREGS
jgi:hypothetical protein